MKREINIGFAGDFCLYQHGEWSASHQVNALNFCKLLNDKVDLAVANHEYTILESGIDTGEMSISADNAGNVADSGFDVFCLANNHIGDFGHDGMLHTRLFLEKRGHKTVGIGQTTKEAIKPLFLEKNGFRIGIVNFCDATQYASGRGRPGLARVNYSLIKKAIEMAREQADLVIVSIHGDLEFTNYPSPWRVRLSRKIAKLGPDMIIQHHPHTLQGVEMVGDTLIAYSLGNFIFPVFGNSYGTDRPGYTNESAYLTVNVTDDEKGKRKISYELTPVIINKSNVTYMPTPEMGREILDKMSRYSAALKNNTKLRKHFHGLCYEEMSTLVTDSYYRTAKRGPIAGLKFFFKHFKTAAHRNWMRGFFTFGQF